MPNSGKTIKDWVSVVFRLLMVRKVSHFLKVNQLGIMGSEKRAKLNRRNLKMEIDL